MRAEQARTLMAAAAVEQRGDVVTVQGVKGRAGALILSVATFSHGLHAQDMRWLHSNGYLALVPVGDEIRVRVTDRTRGYLVSPEREEDLRRPSPAAPSGVERRCAWRPCGAAFVPKTPEQLCCNATHKSYLKRWQKRRQEGVTKAVGGVG